jgi:hypothetical protein
MLHICRDNTGFVGRDSHFDSVVNDALDTNQNFAHVCDLKYILKKKREEEGKQELDDESNLKDSTLRDFKFVFFFLFTSSSWYKDGNEIAKCGPCIALRLIDDEPGEPDELSGDKGVNRETHISIDDSRSSRMIIISS